MHPRHDVPLGKDAPASANAVIEIPMGSKNKYELDENTGLLRLGRVLSTAARYPVNYGFFPRTNGEDGMALDALVFGQEALHPLTILKVRPIGVWTTEAKSGREPKVLAVPADDPRFDRVTEASLLGSRLEELAQFLSVYKTLEGDPVKVVGRSGASAARAALNRAAKAYGGRSWS